MSSAPEPPPAAGTAGRAEPPRIAVDLRALVPEPTGIGVATRALLLEMARHGRFRFLGLAHAPVRGAEELEQAGVELETVAAPWGVLFQQLRLPGRLRRGDCAALWSPVGIAPARCPIASVVTVNDLTPWLMPRAHRWKTLLSQRPFLASTVRGASRLVAISQATADDLARFHPEATPKTRTVHLGIDAEFQPGTPAEIAATRDELEAPEGYLLYAGTIEPRKNLPLLLDAWEDLRGDGRALPLVLAGGYGWRSRDLVQRIDSLVRSCAEDAGPPLIRTGRVARDHLVRLVRAARIFVYPSLYEGFGLPPAEAMACGVPVVVSDVSSLPEVVGDAGRRVPPGDRHALAEAIRNLLDDPAQAERARTAGLARAAELTWSRAARNLEAVFAEAIATGRAPD